jgi:hypothetical protein
MQQLSISNIKDMKQIVLAILLFVAFQSCEIIGTERIKGNGNIVTVDRTMEDISKIKLAGSYEVEITQGSTPALRIETDENIIPLIKTETSEGWLSIKTKKNIRISTTNQIKVYLTVTKLEAVHVAGSGNITGKGKFTKGDKLSLKIAGAGSLTLDVNTPEIKTDIAGSGSVYLSGETRKQDVDIAGSGDYVAEQLQSESAKIDIAGSGDVKIFADDQINIHIAGSGNVYYKGKASVNQKILGGGKIVRLD